MFVRRVVVAGVVVLIVVVGVMTEVGSLATFAGLITAGIAVALQTVILSGVAYFFFIGRFGVRVGDRVTISGITGDVVEIGILRLYLAELAGKPTDLHPTGRIVVSASIPFISALPALTGSAQGDPAPAPACTVQLVSVSWMPLYWL